MPVLYEFSFSVVHSFRCPLVPYVNWCTLYWPDSLQPLFKHVEQGSEIREKIISFLRDKVYGCMWGLHILLIINCSVLDQECVCVFLDSGLSS